MPATTERPRTNGSVSAPPMPPPPRRTRNDTGGYWAALALILGFLVPVLGGIAIWMGVSAHDARKDANKALQAASSGAAMPGMGVSGGGGDLQSFAGQGPDNGAELAAKHTPMNATLPPAPAGPVARVNLVLVDKTLEIAPGVKYKSWAFSGGAPAPFIHVRQGQKVELTLTNKGAIPHSVDFHAARIAPNVAFKDVQPGASIHYTFVAKDPGAFMFHCGTKPVLAHIANGMYGAIIVEPTKPLPHADKNYVLVASEWYLSSPGFPEPAGLDMAKAKRQEPDWVTWNGYAGQYVEHPLTAKPGETVRFWVVDAGPSFDTDFHIVGTILDRAWVNADMTQFQRNVQTVLVPAGGGGVFDVKIDEPGLYPFVSHSFASVDLGQAGLLKVGNVKGTMSH
ncbi:MAG TPA: multicopper oxidase domain-containing protein [Gaiellaceae bacterium]|jgi:nitrite reductase (NO-forming)|nr:multicopper oxidase domain-containing protein [Gaiellaceae bacterium]